MPTILSGTTGNKWQTCCPHQPSGDDSLEIWGLKTFAKNWEERARVGKWGANKQHWQPGRAGDRGTVLPRLAAGGLPSVSSSMSRRAEWGMRAVPGRCRAKQGRWGNGQGMGQGNPSRKFKPESEVRKAGGEGGREQKGQAISTGWMKVRPVVTTECLLSQASCG